MRTIKEKRRLNSSLLDSSPGLRVLKSIGLARGLNHKTVVLVEEPKNTQGIAEEWPSLCKYVIIDP